MIAIDQLTDEQFERPALDLAQREFGPDGLARFLRLNRALNGDYTRDRTEWQNHLTLDQIVESICEHRLVSPNNDERSSARSGQRSSREPADGLA